MTYNFDPERWYDNEKAFLDHQTLSGKMSKVEYAAALRDLEKKLEQMWERLDGFYKLD
jgi:hypothetical protein